MSGPSSWVGVGGKSFMGARGMNSTQNSTRHDLIYMLIWEPTNGSQVDGGLLSFCWFPAMVEQFYIYELLGISHIISFFVSKHQI